MLTDLDYDLLSAYIDGALTDSERADLESRLQAEPELRSELEELQATVTLLNNLPPRKAPRDFTLDARYARRTSFFASAAFSAISTAAAIILFAVGAYLFTNTTQAPTSENAAQVAVMLTDAGTTTATTLDKSADTTATAESLAVDVAPVTAPTILEQEAEATLEDGVVTQSTTTNEVGIGSLFQPDAEEPQDGQDSGNTYGAVPAAPNPSQERSTEPTETTETQLFEVQPTGAMGGAAPSDQPAAAADSNDAMSSMMIAPTETATTPAIMGFASTQPAATFAPTATVVPTSTHTPTATNTVAPTLTSTSTPQPTAMMTFTPVPPVERERVSTTALLPLVLVVLGAVFLMLAVGTTIVRRRNRP
ncbi:MAG: hypothetical protein LCI00_32055 [Chloroflexi bacterium]|nr:hypothetical protein [Chloroflexota bacterium]MCC6894256.1 hypothetical protein [Anaerolineae bacterium]